MSDYLFFRRVCCITRRILHVTRSICARYPSALHILVASQLTSTLLDRALRLLGESFNVLAIHYALLRCRDAGQRARHLFGLGRT
jgi:hypothetical protein